MNDTANVKLELRRSLENPNILNGLRNKIAPYIGWPAKQVLKWHFCGKPKFPMRKNGIGHSAPWVAYKGVVDEWLKLWTQGKVRLSSANSGKSKGDIQ